MVQLDYKNKTYLFGRIDQVIDRLKEIEQKFKTLREYLDYQTREL